MFAFVEKGCDILIQIMTKSAVDALTRKLIFSHSLIQRLKNASLDLERTSVRKRQSHPEAEHDLMGPGMTPLHRP